MAEKRAKKATSEKKAAAGARRKARAPESGESGDVSARVIDAALNLAAERGWRDLSLAEIAAAADLPLSQVYPLFPSKTAILAAYARRLDTAVLTSVDAEAVEGDARERLFEVLMRRFEAMLPHKAAVARIVADLIRDPVMALCAGPSLRRSMACMLEAARLSTSGLRGALRVKALGMIYLATLRVWLDDDSPDMARTMAALDRNLRRAGAVLSCCSRMRKIVPGPGRREAADA